METITKQNFVVEEKWHTMAETAKLIGINGMGRNKMLALLRQKGVLDKWNVPYQAHITNGYFKYTTKDVLKIGKTDVTLVSSRGQEFIKKLIIKNQKNETK